MNYFGGAWYLVILVAAFLGIVWWAFGDKRKERFEQDGKLPFKGSDRRRAAIDAPEFVRDGKVEPTEHLQAANFNADAKTRH